jgi:hypothetical protein
MDYQREKDTRLYKSSLIVNENARLAIIKQREVISCLAQLSSVLQMGLNVSSKDDTSRVPQSVPTWKASKEAKSATPTIAPSPTSNITTIPCTAIVSSSPNVQDASLNY